MATESDDAVAGRSVYGSQIFFPADRRGAALDRSYPGRLQKARGLPEIAAGMDASRGVPRSGVGKHPADDRGHPAAFRATGGPRSHDLHYLTHRLRAGNAKFGYRRGH